MLKYIIAIILLCLLIGIIMYMRKQSNDVTVDNFQHGNPKYHHGVDTKCFKQLPRPIMSEGHPKPVRATIDNAKKCGKCVELEKFLVEEAKSLFTCMEIDNCEPNINMSKYDTYKTCEMCNILLKSWGVYYEVLLKVYNFSQTGLLPPEPNSINYKCSECNNIQQKCKDYSRKVLNETEQIIKGNDYEKVDIPDFTHKFDCKECRNVYDRWTKYTFALMDIGKYSKCISNRV